MEREDVERRSPGQGGLQDDLTVAAALLTLQAQDCDTTVAGQVDEPGHGLGGLEFGAEPVRYEEPAPSAAARMAARSSFFMLRTACIARAARAWSGPVRRSSHPVGTICHDRP